MYEIQMMGIMESDITSINVPYLVDEEQQPPPPPPPPPSSSVSSSAQGQQQQQERLLRTRRSSGSLNDRASIKTDDGPTLAPHKSSLGNDTSYLSRSANFTMTRRSSYYGSGDNSHHRQQQQQQQHQRQQQQQQQHQQQQLEEKPDDTHIDTDTYDALVFKDTLEPTFSRRTIAQASKMAGGSNKSGLSKNSMDTPDMDYSRTNTMKQGTSVSNRLLHRTSWLIYSPFSSSSGLASH
jgi:hypothetical protein